MIELDEAWSNGRYPKLTPDRISKVFVNKILLGIRTTV